MRRAGLNAIGILLLGGLLVQDARAIETRGQTSAARAYARFDAGPVPPETVLRPMRLVMTQDIFKRDALQKLLAEQQDMHSPHYHHWLSADEYGARFGASAQDVKTAAAWLAKSGMENISISRSHTFITFTGSAGAVEQAMQVKLHSFAVNGAKHYANTADPVLPVELRQKIALVQGLDDFVPMPPSRPAAKAMPQYTSASSGQSLGPGDLAMIYDTDPLYKAGVAGSRSTIAVVGAAVPSLADFRAYKQLFGLPANDFRTVVVPGAASTATGGAAIEAALDLEIAGGIAPQAKLLYVEDGDVLGAVAYVIDNNLAQVVSMSYTVCELPGPEDFAYEVLALQGAAEGITWVNAAGDSGAAGCDAAGSSAAMAGLAVDLPASLPEVTGVGGTAFAVGGQYWGQTSGATGTTALGYVPESVWNASDAGLTVTAGGGGVSKDFYKPAFQSSLDDGLAYREVPDVALAANEATPPYLIVVNGEVRYVGGTSAATPLFAGIAALVNDWLLANGVTTQSGLGSMNTQLYRLQEVDGAAFHDVTQGNNRVNCAEGTPDCTTGSFGYAAASGYDMATGLGSVDVYRLASDWSSAAFGTSAVTLAAGNADSSGLITLTATVDATEDPAPGTVIFSWTNAAYGDVPMDFARVAAGDDGVAATTFGGLPAGVNLVSARYQGTTSVLGSVSNALTVNIAMTGTPAATVSLMDGQAQVPAGTYLPFSATVSGNRVAPTGTVSFYLGSTLMGSAPVVAGVASTLSAVLPPVGSDTLTAQYSGDATYAPATSTPFTMEVMAASANAPPAQPVAAPDFSIATPSSVSVTPGGSASIAVTVTPLHGFAAVIQFACTGTVTGFTCAAPAAVTPTASMTVTASLQAQLAAFLPLATMLFFRRRRVAACAVAGGLLLAIAGCGYHANQVAAGEAAAAHTAGSYPITITATSGTLVHTAVVTVNVQ